MPIGNIPDSCEADVKRIVGEFEKPFTPHLRDMLVRAWYSGFELSLAGAPPLQGVDVASMAHRLPSHVVVDHKLIPFAEYLKIPQNKELTRE